MSKRWVAQPDILHWFWDRGFYDGARSLEEDDELVEWCWQNDCEMGLAWVRCPNQEVYTMFALRYACEKES